MMASSPDSYCEYLLPAMAEKERFRIECTDGECSKNLTSLRLPRRMAGSVAQRSEAISKLEFQICKEAELFTY